VLTHTTRAPADVVCAVVGCLAAAASSLFAQAAPVSAHAEVSRTAVWVGDPIAYTVEIVCQPGTDILTEDLSRDRLRLQGLEVSDVQTEEETRPDGTIVHRAHYTLASYSTDTTSLRIEPLRVRYYVRRPGERIDAITPAGEVEVSSIDHARRSTLPDREPAGIRFRTMAPSMAAWTRLLLPLGLLAVALSFLPAALGLAAGVARRREEKARRLSKRRSPEEHRTALEAIRDLSASPDVAAQREAFDRLDAFIRDCLIELDIPARSMTPAEIEGRIGEALRGMPADRIASVLRECQRVRYGGPEQVPDSETLRHSLEQVGDVFSAS
jgi:hypothetical protein